MMKTLYQKLAEQSIALPEYVEVCWRCKGEGQYEQMYNGGCGSGYYRSQGDCEQCNKYSYGHGTGLLSIFTRKVPADSVLNQLENQLKDNDDE